MPGAILWSTLPWPLQGLSDVERCGQVHMLFCPTPHQLGIVARPTSLDILVLCTTLAFPRGLENTGKLLTSLRYETSLRLDIKPGPWFLLTTFSLYHLFLVPKAISCVLKTPLLLLSVPQLRVAKMAHRRVFRQNRKDLGPTSALSPPHNKSQHSIFFIVFALTRVLLALGTHTCTLGLRFCCMHGLFLAWFAQRF